jgi:hypothetical protein
MFHDVSPLYLSNQYFSDSLEIVICVSVSLIDISDMSDVFFFFDVSDHRWIGVRVLPLPQGFLVFLECFNTFLEML